jgi:hypothetical protein
VFEEQGRECPAIVAIELLQELMLRHRLFHENGIDQHQTILDELQTEGRDLLLLPIIGGKDVGSSSLLVIQVHGSKSATSEERVANWKILVNQWRNEHSFRD